MPSTFFAYAAPFHIFLKKAHYSCATPGGGYGESPRIPSGFKDVYAALEYGSYISYGIYQRCTLEFHSAAMAVISSCSLAVLKLYVHILLMT